MIIFWRKQTIYGPCNHEALSIIAESRPTVAMVLAGHDHHGGYHHDAHSNVHHLTLRSPLNDGAAGHAV